MFRKIPRPERANINILRISTIIFQPSYNEHNANLTIKSDSPPPCPIFTENYTETRKISSPPSPPKCTGRIENYFGNDENRRWFPGRKAVNKQGEKKKKQKTHVTVRTSRTFFINFLIDVCVFIDATYRIKSTSIDEQPIVVDYIQIRSTTGRDGRTPVTSHRRYRGQRRI